MEWLWEGGGVTQGMPRYSQRVSTLTEQHQHRSVLFSYRTPTQPSLLLIFIIPTYVLRDTLPWQILVDRQLGEC